MISEKLLAFFVGIIIGCSIFLLVSDNSSNPWDYLDGYGDRAKQQFCFSYDYGETGVGKLFNELAGENPAGTLEELEYYLEEKCD